MKVAKIIDAHTVAITKTGGPHLNFGDILVIHSEDLIDPETGENIGAMPTLRVRITEIYDKFVVAETYRIGVRPMQVTVKVGDDVRVWREVAAPF